MNATLHADAAAIARVLTLARRRLVVVKFWSAFSTFLGVALILGEAVLLFGTRVLPSTAGRWLVCASLAALAFAAAIVSSLWRIPTSREIASVVDRRLQLADRLVSAAQFLGQEDAFARLVERDAASRLSRFHPRLTLPLDTPRTAIAAGLGALALPAAFVLATAVGHRDLTFALRAIGSRAGLEIPAASAEGGRAAATATPDGAGDQAPSAQPAQPRGVELSSRQQTMTAPAVTGATFSPADEHKGDQASATGAAPDRRGTGDPSATAGGVANGALGSRLSNQPQAARSGVDDAAAYREAWSRAQAAVVADRIPADRREVVKRYFAAIRPSEFK